MAAPNIVNVATITMKTAVQLVGTSATAIVSNPASSGKAFKVNALYISNVDGADNTDDQRRHIQIVYRVPHSQDSYRACGFHFRRSI